MYSALVGHDIDSLYLSSSSLCLFLSALQVSLSISLLYFFLALSLPFHSFSLSACLALFQSLSGLLLSLLAWRRSTSLLPMSVCPENQTVERCCLMILQETACSVAAFVPFLLYFFFYLPPPPPVCLSLFALQI